MAGPGQRRGAASGQALGGHGQVSCLLANGCRTPAARRRSSPFPDEFAEGFDRVHQRLRGICPYVKPVGDALSRTDDQLGARPG
ncbi:MULTISPECIES: hypothetical protein [unclassified Streptomyces]|uniref:hypothetical protein n=1 Tax=unclassified Streptomyces TaxID=2593676 RepID=UPI001F1EF847|nr:MULTISPECIES: hypothetical protein [unclassified Streptomyces]